MSFGFTNLRLVNVDNKRKATVNQFLPVIVWGIATATTLFALSNLLCSIRVILAYHKLKKHRNEIVSQIMSAVPGIEGAWAVVVLERSLLVQTAVSSSYPDITMIVNRVGFNGAVIMTTKLDDFGKPTKWDEISFSLII